MKKISSYSIAPSRSMNKASNVGTKQMINKQNTMLMAAALIGLSACAMDHDHSGEFLLGNATDRNIAAQSIRSVDVPNANGLTGQSGERAVAAISRLNTGDQPELSSVSASGLGSTSDN